jgi:hypothetical protein
VPYSVGDRVLVSRHETGEGHEPATVMDSYELIIGDDRRPMVTVEFEDGERIYLKAAPPHVLPAEPEEDEADEDADDEADDEASGTAEEGADRGGDDAHPGPADSSDGG